MTGGTEKGQFVINQGQGAGGIQKRVGLILVIVHLRHL